MYAVWSCSVNVPESERIKLQTDATTRVGSRCVTTNRASGYTAVNPSSP